MLQEAVVILACVTSKGCSQTSGHYFNTNPESKKIMKKHEKKIRDYIGHEEALLVIGPTLFFAAGGTGTIRLAKNWNLQLNKEKAIISYRIEF